MAKLMEERKTTVRNLVLMVAGSLALGYLAITVIGNPIVAAQDRRPGDTPVVLVGGSLRFKAGRAAANDAWQQVVLNQEYYYPATYQVKVIVLKNSSDGDGDGPDPDDKKRKTDRTRVPITNPNWRADLYTLAAANTPVAHLVPQANYQIHLVLDDQSGSLCPVGTPIQRVTYSPSKDCNNQSVSFSKINITVNGVPATPPSLPCQDAAGTNNSCKIVLRAK
jgi:hypothetical protein